MRAGGGILAVTGSLLMLGYTPVPGDAYASIERLESEVLFGAFIRSIHHWSANLLVLVAAPRLLRVLFTGGFLAGRELNWIVGLVLFGTIAASAFTGYLLPWDQLALGGDDRHLHLRGHLAVDLHRNGDFAERLERVGQVDLPLVDLESLGDERLRDVGRSDRPVQGVVLADAAGDLDLGLREPLAVGFRLRLFLEIARLGGVPLALDLLLVGLGDGERQLARQQEVARVAVGDLDNLAASAEVIDVFSENDFHVLSPIC